MENIYDDKWDNPAYVAAVKANIRKNAYKTFLKSDSRAPEVAEFLENISYKLTVDNKPANSFLEKLALSLKEYGKLSPKQLNAVSKILDDKFNKKQAFIEAVQEQKQHALDLGLKAERIEIQVTVEKILTVKAPKFSYYDSSEAYVYIFRDADNNCFKLKTKNILSNDPEHFALDLENEYAVKAGDTITIKASIKAKTEYKGEKQTIIQRVKVI